MLLKMNVSEMLYKIIGTRLLNSVDITDKVKKKNGMNYLPWSSAWEFVKTRFPDAWYEVSTSDIASADGMLHKCNYFTDGKTCWVETTVHIGTETQSEQLPVLDFKNKAVSFETVDSAAVNKAVGGVPTSQHLEGCAADCVVPSDVFNKAIDYITRNLPFDQLLIGKSFFHVSWRPFGIPRRQRIDNFYNY